MSRKIHIDIVKALGIALVVIGHNAEIVAKGSTLYSAIYSFHMPLFFILSGLFLSEKSGLTTQIISKADSLLKPYILVSFVLLLKHSIEVRGIDPNFIGGIFYGNGITIEWMPMWFLTHLFVAHLFSVLLLSKVFVHFKEKRHGVIFALIMLVIGALLIKLFWLSDNYFFPNLSPPGLPFSLDLVFITSAYMMFGYLFRDNIINFKVNHVFGLVSIVCVIGFNMMSNAYVDLNLRNYGDIVMVNLKIASSVYMLIYFSCLLSKTGKLADLLSFIGQASMFILIFHFFIQAAAYKVLSNTLSIEQPIAAIAAFILGLILPVMAYWLTLKSSFLKVLFLPIKLKRGASAKG